MDRRNASTGGAGGEAPHVGMLLDSSTAGLSPCDVEALKACLERNNNDGARCVKEIQAFQRACGKASPGKK